MADTAKHELEAGWKRWRGFLLALIGACVVGSGSVRKSVFLDEFV